MTGILLPKFPDKLDTNAELYHVFNTSESPLRLDFSLEDMEIYIVPREWSRAEIWNKESGIINIEGELIHYTGTITEEDPSSPNSIDPQFTFFDDPGISEEEKNKYRRVITFTNITRGINQTLPRLHLKGEWARGHVMAEHHNSLMRAVLGIENLIGINDSIDHSSLDYKLRDLDVLVDEIDDEECPYGIFWFEILNSTGTTKTVQFHISIIGDFESFQFVPKEGETPIEDDLNPIYTYAFHEEIEASLTVLKTNCCSCVTENSVPCEPCQFEPLLEDIPTLDLPVIVIDPPVFVCETECVLECPEIEPCLTQTCPTEPTTPIEIPPFTYEISLSIPGITITAPTVDVNVNVNVEWSGPEDSSGEGACFRLIPCGGVTS